MAFKSEIHVAELASIRTGHTEGDIYYILDNGMLGDLPCKPGTFVKWHNDTWQIQPDEHYALASDVDGDIAQAIDNVLDSGLPSETIVVAVPSSQSGNYTVGDYYEVQGKVAKLRTKTEGDNVTELTFDTTSGVLEAMNNVVEDIAGKVEVFQVVYDTDHYTWPSFSDINAVVTSGKSVCLVQTTLRALTVYWLTYESTESDNLYFRFVTGTSGYADIYQDGSIDTGNLLVKPATIAADYPSLTYPIAEGAACMYNGLRYVANTDIATSESWTPAHWTQKSVEDEIGNVEALLAAL